MPHYRNEYNRNYYTWRRRQLVAKLGGRCVDCAKEGVLTIEKLQFDHTHGRTWCMKKYGPLQRLKKIEQEAARGEIELVCPRHNTLRYHRRPQSEAEVELQEMLRA